MGYDILQLQPFFFPKLHLKFLRKGTINRLLMSLISAPLTIQFTVLFLVFRTCYTINQGKEPPQHIAPTDRLSPNAAM